MSQKYDPEYDYDYTGDLRPGAESAGDAYQADSGPNENAYRPGAESAGDAYRVDSASNGDANRAGHEPDEDGYREDWSDWESDIPDSLEIEYEGASYHRHSGQHSHQSTHRHKSRHTHEDAKRSTGRRVNEDADQYTDWQTYEDPHQAADPSAHSHARRQRQAGTDYVDRNGRVHSRAPLSDTTRHTHRRVHGWKRALIITGIVLVSLALVVVITWRVLDAVGRGRLYQEGNAAPTLVSDDSELEIEAETGEDIAETVTWEADWIRYNGTVYDFDEDVLTFLVMGIDHTDEADVGETALDGGQADALFLLVMDPGDQEISILAINRHTMTDIDIYNENNEYLYTMQAQICLQHAYGDGLEQSCERQVAVVSDLLYGLTINGYAAINMGAIPTINNAVGGVTLEALQDIPVSSRDSSFLDTYYSDTHRDLYEGETYTLSGTEAYWYTKYRDIHVSDSASARLQRQKQYLKIFMSDMKSAVSEDLTVALDLYNAISAYMVTDIDLSEFTYLASNIAGYSLNLDEFYEIDGELITGETGTATGFDEFYLDEDSLYEVMLQLFYDVVEF